MVCDEVRDRLVALHDDELSPSEVAQVREHVATCPSCAGANRRIVRSTPTAPSFGPGDALRARLSQQLDPSLILALAERPVVVAPRRALPLSVVWRGFTHVASIPVGAVVVYILLLAASFGWGVSNWLTLSALRAPATESPTPTGTEIPADQFRPAAWDPSADPDGH
jgi:anti-sigma factor RsiW